MLPLHTRAGPRTVLCSRRRHDTRGTHTLHTDINTVIMASSPRHVCDCQRDRRHTAVLPFVYRLVASTVAQPRTCAYSAAVCQATQTRVARRPAGRRAASSWGGPVSSGAAKEVAALPLEAGRTLQSRRCALTAHTPGACTLRPPSLTAYSQRTDAPSTTGAAYCRRVVVGPDADVAARHVLRTCRMSTHATDTRPPRHAARMPPWTRRSVVFSAVEAIPGRRGWG